MNNIGSLIPFSSLRRSFKRSSGQESNNASNSTTSTNKTDTVPKRSASVKRLPFSTIKDTKNIGEDFAELPPSPKLLENTNNKSPLYSPYCSKTTLAAKGDLSSPTKTSHAFVRSNKTASFHTYRRRNFR